MSRAQLLAIALKSSQDLDTALGVALTLVRTRQQESEQELENAGDNDADRDQALEHLTFWMQKECEFEELQEQAALAHRFLEQGSSALFLSLVLEIRATIALRKRANEPQGIVIFIDSSYDGLLLRLSELEEKRFFQLN